MKIIISEDSVCRNCIDFQEVKTTINNEKIITSTCLLNDDLFYEIYSMSESVVSEIFIEKCSTKKVFK